VDTTSCTALRRARLDDNPFVRTAAATPGSKSPPRHRRRGRSARGLRSRADDPPDARRRGAEQHGPLGLPFELCSPHQRDRSRMHGFEVLAQAFDEAAKPEALEPPHRSFACVFPQGPFACRAPSALRGASIIEQSAAPSITPHSGPGSSTRNAAQQKPRSFPARSGRSRAQALGRRFRGRRAAESI